MLINQIRNTQRYILLSLCVCITMLSANYASGATDVAAVQEALHTDLVIDHIDITTGFNGAHLDLYGVKAPSSDLVIILRGPEKDMQVRRKEKTKAGWRFMSDVTFKSIPSYYSGVSTKPIETILSEDQRMQYHIGVDQLRFDTDYKGNDAELSQFQSAFIRTQKQQKLIVDEFGRITQMGDRFFKARFYLPHNVPVGMYIAQIFSIENGEINLENTAWHDVFVSQVGVNSYIHKVAKENPFFYGLFCVFLAIVAGWISNRLKRIL